MILEPCPSCARHVRASDRSCPFCGAVIDGVPSRVTPSERLGRAALFAFGAAMATNVAACSATTTQQSDTGAPDDAAVAADAGPADAGQQDSGFFPPYGTPPIDTGPHDAGTDTGGLMGAYGAPPPRDAGPDAH